MINFTNGSFNNHVKETVKASFYLVDFLICFAFAILIIPTVSRHSVLRKEVRFSLLCHHLKCLTLFFGLGTIFSGIRAFQINSPVIVCWMVFAVQIVFGRALLMTLVLMTLNICIAVCWPLKYQSFVHAVKWKIIIVMWIIAVIDPAVSVVFESLNTPELIVQLDPECPTTLSGVFSRTAGMIFILLLGCILLICYILIVREGRKAGHFNSTNLQAKRTVLIHGLQISLHFLPTLVTIGISGNKKYDFFDLISFIIFSFAQCLSPVVYGLRCTELRQKIILKMQQ